MKRSFPALILFCCFSYFLSSQNLQVSTLMNLDASGGVTFGPDGNLHVSDFGPALGQASVNTKVYRIEYGTWEVEVFAQGFSGASGATFDSQGNFYQSNPSGGRVSRVSADGSLDLNWVTTGLSAPIGIIADENDNLFVCNCGNNTIRRITSTGLSLNFASSSLFNCPNGLTRDPEGNLYACNFSDGRVLKITPEGDVSLFVTLPNFGGVGNGHLTYKNGFIFLATISGGEIYKISLDGEAEKIAGVFQGFSNEDGPALSATFSKPNGIAASSTGDTLFVNCSIPNWPTSNTQLHPGVVRMITGVCSLPDVECPAITDVKDQSLTQNHEAVLHPNRPNPFQDQSTLAYELKEAMPVELVVFDNQGRLIRELVNEKQGPGSYELELQTNDWAPGKYQLLLKGDGFQLSRSIILVR